jgi:hypothetical protein
MNGAVHSQTMTDFPMTLFMSSFVRYNKIIYSAAAIDLEIDWLFQVEFWTSNLLKLA